MGRGEQVPVTRSRPAWDSQPVGPWLGLRLPPPRQHPPSVLLQEPRPRQQEGGGGGLPTFTRTPGRMHPQLSPILTTQRRTHTRQARARRLPAPRATRRVAAGLAVRESKVRLQVRVFAPRVGPHDAQPHTHPAAFAHQAPHWTPRRPHARRPSCPGPLQAVAWLPPGSPVHRQGLVLGIRTPIQDRWTLCHLSEGGDPHVSIRVSAGPSCPHIRNS